MNRQYLSFTVLLCFLALVSCRDASVDADAAQVDAPSSQSVTAPAPATKNKPAPKPPRKQLAADDPFVISGGAILGIRPGDAIASVEGAQKTTLKTGEGSSTVYTLVKGKRELGYLMPDPKDPKKIRSINVSSKRFMTPEGISVGSTFGELNAAVNGVVVHGSEAGGKTYAVAGKTKFRLKAANFSYEVDKATIKPETKIVEIIVD